MPPRRSSRSAGFARAVALAGAAVVALAGCSSSGAAVHSTHADPSRPTSATATAALPTAAPVSLGAADRTQIATAYATFFGGATSAAKATHYLQHGSAFAAVLAEQASSAQAKSLSARVTSTAAKTPHVATVTFTLSSNGSALLPNTNGYAVREGGRWKVATATFCQLLTLQQSAPEQCSDASLTALPTD